MDLSSLRLDKSKNSPLMYLALLKPTIKKDHVFYIEGKLEPEEVIYLIYLLFSKNNEEEIAIQYALLSSQSGKTPIQDWANLESNTCWCDELLEALTLIKRFDILQELGYNRERAILRYEPTNINAVKVVNSFRKKTFLILEDLTQDEIQKLIEFVQNKKSLYEIDLSKATIELHLLRWMSKKVITSSDPSLFIQALESLNKTDLVKKFNGENINLPGSSEALVQILSQAILSDVEYYKCNPSKMGVCVIINQKIFTNEKFEPRIGTDMDRDKLEETFLMFGFEVHKHEDLTSKQIKMLMHYLVQYVIKPWHCSLVVCILTHGCQGVVFGTDGEPVRIEYIHHCFLSSRCPNLKGKPKIFLIQSCQGDKLEIAVSSIAFDTGPSCSKPTVPLCFDGNKPIHVQHADHSDRSTFYSSLPGFTALRCMVEGSHFINSFCDTLTHNWQYHTLNEVFTLTNRVASQRIIPIDQKYFTIMPMYESTLTKEVQLKIHPPGLVKATIKRLKRQLMKLLLDEFLFKSIKKGRFPMEPES